MHTAHPSKKLQAETPPRMPGILLWLAAAALIACSLMAASAYVYTVLTVGVSEYRRHLNDGAYKAQLYLDQREALLRAIAATSVRGDGLETHPAHAGHDDPQLQPLSLPEPQGTPPWQLAVTRRMLSGLALADVRLIHTTVAPLRSHVLEFDADGAPHWRELPAARIPPAIASMPLPDHERRPITWLRQPGSEAPLLAVYAPMDRRNAGNGWIGLELEALRHRLCLPDMPDVGYILLDSQGSVVLRSAQAPAHLAGLQDDYFGLRNTGRLPHDIALSKGIGSGGLRVVYSVPVRRLLADVRGTLLRTALLELGFIVLVLVAAQAARRLFLVPAQRQHQALLESVELNRTLIATAPVGLAVVDNDDGMVLRENALARRWMDHDDQWRARLARRESAPAHADIDLDDGHHVQVTAVPLAYRGLDVSLCVVSDVTARKQTEASLVAARRMAERASQAKTRFLATMSHEIRTPLYGITGTLELLEAIGGDERQKHYLDLLHRAAAALVRTVDDSLDLSRIESGHMELETSEFCLLSLVDETIAAFAARAESKGLLLYAVADLAPGGSVIGDPRHIRQILGNLVGNAIKFTDAGQVVVRVKAVEHADGRPRFRFHVSDTGPGIEPESLAHLFEPYYRAGSTLSRNVPGTGLGLAISNRLARLMDGTLQVVSQPGIGTRVSLELPLQRGQGNAALRGLYPPLLRRPVYVAGLLPEVVDNLCRWLSHWGALAVPCSGPRQRLEPGSVLLHAWPPARELPAWNGRQVVARPASSGREPEVAGTALSAPAHALLGIGWAVHRAQQERSAAAGDAAASLGPPLRLQVMVVDDSPINQSIVKAQLALLGCTATLADSGADALRHSGLQEFDAVLTDLNMPSMSGYALARTLRAQGYRGLILGTSADALQDTCGRWRAAGMDAMLVKPLFLSTLRGYLQALQRSEA
ncbi:ATP-binding protein [Stenotrophomonas mori]|uniref:histidine kinase n=1 Tax=Stenotrophomonas mori TaxID=2871096 RepID=A0ABT0SJP5_9GAMM|nr:ATP-binding protein [Stenotrophomonas mori]MCL7715562.1 response regulator [Stenotrophomonas mori]